MQNSRISICTQRTLPQIWQSTTWVVMISFVARQNRYIRHNSAQSEKYQARKAAHNRFELSPTRWAQPWSASAKPIQKGRRVFYRVYLRDERQSDTRTRFQVKRAYHTNLFPTWQHSSNSISLSNFSMILCYSSRFRKCNLQSNTPLLRGFLKFRKSKSLPFMKSNLIGIYRWVLVRERQNYTGK